MDKTKELDDFILQLDADMFDSASNLLKIRDELVPVLEQELEDAKIRGQAQTISSEVLRKYIVIARNVQKLIFEEVYTHIMTIEKLSDHILCRRKVLEDNKVKPKTVASVANSTASVDLLSKMAELTKGMTQEQMEQFMAKLRGD